MVFLQAQQWLQSETVLKSQHCKPSPNNTHFVSATHSNKKRNIQRMEAFLAKKRAGVPATTSQQTASETVSEESPTTLSYADALATGAGTHCFRPR